MTDPHTPDPNTPDPNTAGPNNRANRLHLGAAYYYEYPLPGAQPTLERLATDMAHMRAAGLTLIRVGESVWSTWEPRDGEFDLDWLQPVLDAAAEHGLSVMLGTPTYALPMWLAAKHPDIAGDIATGTALGWGARQEMDFTHPAFLSHAERVIRAVIGRYGNHPSVVGIQVDNEPGLRLLYNEGVFQRFVSHLRDTYGSIDKLNDAWGLVYWSHRLTDFSELWRPDGNAQPQYHLAWRRFQAQLVTDYIAWQAGIVREIVGTGTDAPFVTTCISYEQVAMDDQGVSDALDLTSANVYYSTQEALAVPTDAPMSGDWITDGTWGVYELADLAYSSKQAEFWVTETNAGGIGQNAYNLPSYDGQLRQIAWALVSRGARAVEYWHWHTLHYGMETYWIGVVPHDEAPGRIYQEVSRIGAEFDAVAGLFAGATPDADVAFLYSHDSKWALSAKALSQPTPAYRHLANEDSYRELALPFYRAAFDAGLQVNIVRPSQLVDGDAPPQDPAAFALRRPVLVVAGDFVTSDAMLAWLESYAVAGGHLLLGPRSAYGDEEARARVDAKPSRLADAAGVTYQEFETPAQDIPLSMTGGGPLAPAEDAQPVGAQAQHAKAQHARAQHAKAQHAKAQHAHASLWVEYLEPHGAEVLATYDHPHLGRYAAITSRAHGAGRITVVGTVPDQHTLARLLEWAASSPSTRWDGVPEDVRVTSSTLADGRRAWFVHHWGWGSAPVTAPIALADAVSGDPIAAGETLVLGPWDVRVLVSLSSTPTTRTA